MWHARTDRRAEVPHPFLRPSPRHPSRRLDPVRRGPPTICIVYRCRFGVHPVWKSASRSVSPEDLAEASSEQVVILLVRRLSDRAPMTLMFVVTSKRPLTPDRLHGAGTLHREGPAQVVEMAPSLESPAAVAEPRGAGRRCIRRARRRRRAGVWPCSLMLRRLSSTGLHAVAGPGGRPVELGGIASNQPRRRRGHHVAVASGAGPDRGHHRRPRCFC
jgi:hypothetical protein